MDLFDGISYKWIDLEDRIDLGGFVVMGFFRVMAKTRSEAETTARVHNFLNCAAAGLVKREEE